MAEAVGSTEHNKKKIFIIAGIALVVIILLVVGIKLRGGSAPVKAGTTAAPAGNAMMGRRPGGMARGGKPGSVTTTTPASATKAPAATSAASGKGAAPNPAANLAKQANRVDPFASQPMPPKPPRPPVLPPQPVLPAAATVAGGIRVAGPNVIVVTARRTAGLLWNGEVYGLLQLGKNTYIVRPGDTVDEYKVSAITRDSIILYSPSMGKQIQVPLSGPRAEPQEKSGPVAPAEIDGLRAQPSDMPGEQGSQEDETEEIAPALPEFSPE